MFRDPQTPYLKVSDVMNVYNNTTARNDACPLSAKSVGYLIRERLGLSTTKTRGVYVIPQDEREKVAALVARYGLPLDQHGAISDIAVAGLLARSAEMSF